ncbi:MAG: hypothetical protein SVN78_10525 [Deferribacterota bacterium]|nr:hypothetical protein [Deferribacterota bacterium]
MIKNPLRGYSSIAGIGFTKKGRIEDRTALSFHVEACANAIKDAGLKKDTKNIYYLSKDAMIVDLLGGPLLFITMHIMRPLKVEYSIMQQ